MGAHDRVSIVCSSNAAFDYYVHGSPLGVAGSSNAKNPETGSLVV